MMMTVDSVKSTGLAGTPARTRSATWALAGLSLSMLMPSLDTSIANASLPTLSRVFSSSFQGVQWIVLAYLLAITASTVAVGRFGDILGRRRLLLAGVALFTTASLLCGIAPALWFLIAARAAQGLGAAIMMSLAVALAGDAVPRARTGTAMGLLGMMSAIGTTLGPSLGGLLVASLGWQIIFLINVPLGLLNFVLVSRFLPMDRRETGRDRSDFDTTGTLLLALTLAAYALAMTLGRGHFGPANIALLLTAAGGAGLFLFVEAGNPSPIVRLTVFRDPVLSAGLAMSALVSTVMMATLVVGPFYLLQSLGLEPARVGVALSVGPLVAALTGMPAGRLVDRLGSRPVTIVGLVGMMLGTSALSLLPARYGIAGYLGPIVLVTMSYALFQTANNTGLMTGAPRDERGVLSGLLSLSRNLGLITGAAVMGAVFAWASGSADPATSRPEAVAGGMRTTFAVASLLMTGALAIAARTRANPLAIGDWLSAIRRSR
ncbi:MAG: MFS transporter [Verrucomicrobiota bacterium]